MPPFMERHEWHQVHHIQFHEVVRRPHHVTLPHERLRGAGGVGFWEHVGLPLNRKKP